MGDPARQIKGSVGRRVLRHKEPSAETRIRDLNEAAEKNERANGRNKWSVLSTVEANQFTGMVEVLCFGDDEGWVNDSGCCFVDKQGLSCKWLMEGTEEILEGLVNKIFILLYPETFKK